MAATGPDQYVFVGGAPRSGTTVTHALICSSRSVSAYHPEASFYRGIPVAYRNGKAAWGHHTKAFFDTPEDFRLLMRRTSDVSLDHLWRTLGSPRILALKDPLLTPLFPDVHALYPAEAKFVSVVRHPFDVVRSREEVHARSGSGRPFGEPDVVAVSREYLSFYRTLLNTNFGGKHFMFRYEDLNTPRIQQGLAEFVGVNDFDVSRMWLTKDDTPPDPEEIAADAWGSPKYYQEIDLEPRFEPLAERWRDTVRAVCAPIMSRFGYS